MQRKTFIKTLAVPFLAAGGLFAGTSGLLLAQTPVELQFYYPVAVGGPIAKTIDGFAAGFMNGRQTRHTSPKPASAVSVSG